MIMCKLSPKAVDEILEKGRIYEVGGAVRDRMLSLKPPVKDRDYLVTGIGYDDLTRILRRHGRVDMVGKSFGVIKYTQFSGKTANTFDITLPRTEHSTGQGHRDFAVSYDPDLKVEDDLIRRDFTVNAMALALDTDQLIDPLHGSADIQNRQLRMTSANSFTEDPLRMLRAVQFAARFEFMIEPETFKSIMENAHRIETVSAERIAEELVKLLERSEKPSEGFRLMQTSGLLARIMPELETCVGVTQPGGYHRFNVFEHIIRTIDAAEPRLRLRLAALFHDITKPKHRRLTEKGASFYGHEISGGRVAKKVLSRLKFSRDLTSEVQTLVERHMFTTDVSGKGLRRLVRKVGIDLIFDLLDLRRADVVAQGMGGKTEDVDQFEDEIKAELKRKPPFSIRDLAIDGKDLMKLLELSPSPVLGKILDHLLELVLDDPDRNSPADLEKAAAEFYKTECMKEKNAQS